MPALYSAPDPATLPSYFDFGYLPPAGTFFTIGSFSGGDFIGTIYLVKAIANPNDPSVTVNIPVRVKIQTRDASQQFWDSDWTFDPQDGSGDARSWHVVTVYNTGNLAVGGSDAGADPSQTLDVERCDSFTIYFTDDTPFAAGQTWEYEIQLDNVTGEGDQSQPAHFRHTATHVARWYASNGAGNITDTNTFLDIEYVDAFDRLQGDDGAVGALINQEYLFKADHGWFSTINDDGSVSTASNPQPLAIG